MFKCKQCGRGFSANLPDHCPACGTENRQPENLGNGKVLGLIIAFASIEVIAMVIILGIVIALAIKYL